jgi:hypothetical protein
MLGDHFNNLNNYIHSFIPVNFTEKKNPALTAGLLPARFFML